jgi:hypothetical protein
MGNDVILPSYEFEQRLVGIAECWNQNNWSLQLSPLANVRTRVYEKPYSHCVVLNAHRLLSWIKNMIKL